MSRLNTIVIAIGGVAFATMLPLAARAHTGDALAKAENVCIEEGIGPEAVPFESCVVQTALALERGETGSALGEARKVEEVSKACMSNDMDPMTSEFRQCMASATDQMTASLYETQQASMQ